MKRLNQRRLVDSSFDFKYSMINMNDRSCAVCTEYGPIFLEKLILMLLAQICSLITTSSILRISVMPPSYSKPSFLLFLKPIVIIQLFFLTFHLSFVHELH